MEEISVFAIFGNSLKNSKILISFKNLITLASGDAVLALVTPQENAAKSIAS